MRFSRQWEGTENQFSQPITLQLGDWWSGRPTMTRGGDMPGEASIENSVIRNRESVLGIRDSLYIRRCRMGPGFGVADLVILPQRGKHKLIIVEAKQASSADAKIKVLGQLLMYYAGALEFGLSGVRLMQQYAVKRHAHARSHHKSRQA